MYVALREMMLGHIQKDNHWQLLNELGNLPLEVAFARDLTTLYFRDENGKPYNLSIEKEAQGFKERLEKQGSRLCAFLMGNDFSRDDLDKEIEWAVNACRIARDLGVGVIRIDMAPHKKDFVYKDFLSTCIDTVKKILMETKKSGITLAVENHGFTSNREDFLDEVFKKIDSPRLGLTLDTGNFYWYGNPLSKTYELIEKFSSRVKATHCKNIKYPLELREKKREIGWEYGKYVSPIYEGDIDHAKVVKILKHAGYSDAITVEDESLSKFDRDKKIEIIKKDIEHLKESAR